MELLEEAVDAFERLEQFFAHWNSQSAHSDSSNASALVEYIRQVHEVLPSVLAGASQSPAGSEWHTAKQNLATSLTKFTEELKAKDQCIRQLHENAQAQERILDELRRNCDAAHKQLALVTTDYSQVKQMVNMAVQKAA